MSLRLKCTKYTLKLPYLGQDMSSFIKPQPYGQQCCVMMKLRRRTAYYKINFYGQYKLYI